MRVRYLRHRKVSLLNINSYALNTVTVVVAVQNLSGNVTSTTNVTSAAAAGMVAAVLLGSRVAVVKVAARLARQSSPSNLLRLS